MTRTITVKLPPAIAGALDAKIERTGLTTSEVVRLALIEALIPEEPRVTTEVA